MLKYVQMVHLKRLRKKLYDPYAEKYNVVFMHIQIFKIHHITMNAINKIDMDLR